MYLIIIATWQTIRTMRSVAIHSGGFILIVLINLACLLII
jgi:hypothetical protein